MALFTVSLASYAVPENDDAPKELIQFDTDARKMLLKQLGITSEYADLEASPEIGIAIIDDDFGSLALDKNAYPARYEIINKYDAAFLKENNLPEASNDANTLYPQLDNFGLDARPKDASKFLPHGLAVAQSVMGVLGRHTRVKFYFLNGNMAFNFVAAAHKALDLYQKGLIKTVIHSASFYEYGVGNGDSPLDKIVEGVLEKTVEIVDGKRNIGLKWFNAAGNDGQQVWAGKARLLDGSRYVDFRPKDKKWGHCLRFKNKSPGNTLTITLAWDGRLTGLRSGTRINYDLEIVDNRGRLIVPGKDLKHLTLTNSKQSVPPGNLGTKRQLLYSEYKELKEQYQKDLKEAKEKGLDPKSVEDKSKGTTILPYEQFVLSDLPKTTDGEYCIRVRAASEETRESDSLQVVIQAKEVGQSQARRGEMVSTVNFIDHNRENEMFPPATARNVVSVGSLGMYSSIALNSTTGRPLPHLVTVADRYTLSNSQFEEGSSFSAPFVAAMGVLMETMYPHLTHREFMQPMIASPGPVTVDYVRNNFRNGKVLLSELFNLTELEDKDIKTYMYPHGVALVELPLFPANYGRLAPDFPTEQERNHLDGVQYFFGLRRSEDGEAIAFTIPRPKAASETDFPLPWEDNQRLAEKGYFPYDQANPGRKTFQPDDFIVLEKRMKLPKDVDMASLPLDTKLRQGEPRSTPLRTFVKMPSKQKLKRIMEGR